MNEDTKPQVPVWFWIVGVVCLLWNLAGVGAYIAQVTQSAADIAAMPEADRLMLENTPAWAHGAFAIAVFAGVLGCLLLLLRSRFALPVLILSFAGVVVQMSFIFLVSKDFTVYGPGQVAMPAMVIVIGLFLIWFASMAGKRGWLRSDP